MSCLGMQFRGPPGGKHVFKMASSPVTRIQTLHFWRMRDQRFEQVNHFVLPRFAYYNSNTIRVCVASVSGFQQRSDRWRQPNGSYHGGSSDILNMVRSSHSWSLKPCCRQRNPSIEGLVMLSSLLQLRGRCSSQTF